jgi:hypothetical protein
MGFVDDEQVERLPNSAMWRALGRGDGDGSKLSAALCCFRRTFEPGLLSKEGARGRREPWFASDSMR